MKTDMMKSLLLLFLSVLAGTFGDIFSCKIKKLMDNIYFKHIGLLILIYVTIILVEKEHSSFYDNIIETFKIWLFYLIMVRINTKMTFIVVILILIEISLNNHIKYIEDNNKEKDKLYKYSKILKPYSNPTLYAIMLISFIYFVYKKSERENISVDFILGKLKC